MLNMVARDAASEISIEVISAVTPTHYCVRRSAIRHVDNRLIVVANIEDLEFQAQLTYEHLGRKSNNVEQVNHV
jgi:hypothetical protein